MKLQKNVGGQITQTQSVIDSFFMQIMFLCVQTNLFLLDWLDLVHTSKWIV